MSNLFKFEKELDDGFLIWLAYALAGIIWSLLSPFILFFFIGENVILTSLAGLIFIWIFGVIRTNIYFKG